MRLLYFSPENIKYKVDKLFYIYQKKKSKKLKEKKKEKEKRKGLTLLYFYAVSVIAVASVAEVTFNAFPTVVSILLFVKYVAAFVVSAAL